MAFWKLSTLEKKNAEEKQLWYRDGVTIEITESYRWGSFVCDSATKPEVDLENPDGFSVNEDPDNDWEIDFLDDGWYGNVEHISGEMSLEELDNVMGIFQEGGYSALEEEGWEDLYETEYILYGPLKLERVGKDV
jgi:hypothetical protein